MGLGCGIVRIGNRPHPSRPAISLQHQSLAPFSRRRESNCVEATQGLHSAGGCQGVLALSIAFRIVNNLRMQAVNATLAGLPACRKRW